MLDKIKKIKEICQGFTHPDVDTGIEEAIELCVELNTFIESNGWQDIESAPKDGSEIDVYTADSEFPTREVDVRWRRPSESEYWVNGLEEPTYEERKDGAIDEKAAWFTPFGCVVNPTHFKPITLPAIKSIKV